MDKRSTANKTEDLMALDSAKEDLLILVDVLDRPIGSATKEQAHRQGLLHRAFSLQLYRETGAEREYLISRRAMEKYHAGGLWANSCCSHPRKGETVPDAAACRVRQELGCGADDMREIGCFLYRTAFSNGLFEYEYDHVLLARIAGEPAPDPAEVSEIRWVTADELNALLVRSPNLFAPWAFTVLSIILKETHNSIVSPF